MSGTPLVQLAGINSRVVRQSFDALNRAIGLVSDRVNYGSEWDATHQLKLGAYYLWVDSTGDLRVKSGAPTSDTDGTIVGTQS